MQPVFTLISATLLASVAVSATVLPTHENPAIWKSPYNGTIDFPTTDDVVVPGTDFAFGYTVSNWCEASFSPFTVYLTQGDAPPPFGAVTENGTLAQGSYVYNFGRYAKSNFGMPYSGEPSSPPPPPPPGSLNIPEAVAKTIRSQPYLIVVEEFNGCPGHIVVEYSLVSVPLSMKMNDVD